MSLEQTKGQFQLVGVVKGLDDYEQAVNDGVTRSDKPYKSLRFMVQTSEDNVVPVEMFGMVRDEVIFYNMKEREKKKVKWDDRGKSHKPFALMGVNLNIEKNDKGSAVKKTKVEYDAVDYIFENLNDGDSVFVRGDLDFQEYENQEGKVVNSTKFIIKGISKTKEPVNFEAEDFKEKSIFEQDIVVWDVEKDEKKLNIFAKNIKFTGEHVDANFVVDGEKYPKLANNMAKRLKLGDFIKVYGNLINKVEMEEEEGVEEDAEDWGGDEEVKEEMNKNYIKNYIRELSITSVDSTTYESKMYNEEDFMNEDEDNYGDDFADGVEEGEDVEDDDEDLPFG